MILLLHIAAALSSLAFTAYMLFRPSSRKLQASYGLVGLTLTSGVALVVIEPRQLTHFCVTSLVYLAVVYAGIYASRRRLSGVKVQADAGIQ
jgi:hypothetical protein